LAKELFPQVFIINQDGIGLFAGIIKSLNKKCTKLVVSTHFYEVFTDDFINSLDGILFCHFSTVEVENRFEFIYELQNGLCGKSLGIQCAKASGCPANVIQRAKEVADAINNGDPIPLLNENKAKNEAAHLISELFRGIDLQSADLERDLWSHLRQVEHLF
jgi:DNA mismatch repair ATPase MutS